MPFRIPDAIKKFTLELSDTGLPLARVILLGGIRYVEVCPCCSCLHPLPVTHRGDTYEPRCLWREWGRLDYQKWVAQHPEAAKHKTVMLVERPVVHLVTTPIEAAPVKRPRRKAA